MSEGSNREKARPFLLSQLVEELVTEAQETLAAAAEGRARGPITGLPGLDAHLGGHIAAGLHVVTGDPGAGKTALALQIASCCGTPALFVTAEQSRLVLFQRLIARATGTPKDEVRHATPERIRELAAQTAEAVPRLALLEGAGGAAPVEHVEDVAASLQEYFHARHVLLCVDSLQCWARAGWEGAEYDVNQTGLSSLAGLAGRRRWPIFVLSHRNRESARAKGSGAELTAAKGSADFEHLAETLLHLKLRQSEIDPYSDEPVRVEAFLAKNRWGPSHFNFPLVFHGRTDTFREG